jgi:hypothetical protein
MTLGDGECATEMLRFLGETQASSGNDELAEEYGRMRSLISRRFRPPQRAVWA